MASVEIVAIEAGFRLDGTLNLWTMGRDLALDFSGSDSQYQIDLGQLQSPDSGVIVQMLSWVREANTQNVNVTFVNTPAQLVSLIDLYDLESIVNLA